jgi:hypothetical protein
MLVIIPNDFRLVRFLVPLPLWELTRGKVRDRSRSSAARRTAEPIRQERKPSGFRTYSVPLRCVKFSFYRLRSTAATRSMLTLRKSLALVQPSTAERLGGSLHLHLRRCHHLSNDACEGVVKLVAEIPAEEWLLKDTNRWN